MKDVSLINEDHENTTPSLFEMSLTQFKDLESCKGMEFALTGSCRESSLLGRDFLS